MTVLVTSAVSSPASITGTANAPWLKDPLDPTRNMELDITGDEFVYSGDSSTGSFDPLGRRNPIVISDVVKGEEFDFTAYVLTKAEEDKFDVLYNSVRTLLLQLPDGRQWYIRMRKRKKRLPPGTGPFIYIDVTAVETDEPPNAI